MRLVGGAGTPCDAVHSGFVQVFNASTFGGLCADRFGVPRTTAEVVCRQLGFTRGFVLDNESAGGNPTVCLCQRLPWTLAVGSQASPGADMSVERFDLCLDSSRAA